MNLTRNCPGFAALAVAALILAPMAALGQKVPLMTVDQLKARLGDGKTAIIDVRRPTNDPEGKIKIAGAVAEAWDKPSQWASKYDPERIIVLYCAWPDEYTSARVALQLIRMGYKKVYALKGGWEAWRKAGYPVEKK